ncbi:MAG: 50S ribosomal protein L17 [Candidatus Marinimicrobia bacterium]|nr:50S ribosomal protein L17 [Candidatus Neomarinimicrobiota bacterium]|tara:strand:+ start:376 stop:777 length:402 start_codon:yes stop_codon:yes gene_type:complete
MRHRKSGRKLGRKAGHRRAVMSNLASQLIEHKRIKTTEAKAKELRVFIEPLVTFARRGDLHARRQVLRKIPHKDIVSILFNDIGPVYTDRDGGYTRIIKLGFRDNDRAPVSMIEFVDFASEQLQKEPENVKKD